jgi:hypothetical protein
MYSRALSHVISGMKESLRLLVESEKRVKRVDNMEEAQSESVLQPFVKMMSTPPKSSFKIRKIQSIQKMQLAFVLLRTAS